MARPAGRFVAHRQRKIRRASGERKPGPLHPSHRQQKRWRATMRTKFITTLAAAALLSVSGAAAALAQAADTQASTNDNAATFVNDGAYANGVNPTNSGFAPNVG